MYLSLVLTEVKYKSNNTISNSEWVGQRTYDFQHERLRKYVVDIVMKKSLESKSIPRFDGVGAIFTFTTQFVSIINCIKFPCKSKGFNSFNINFYVINNTATANEIYGSLWKSLINCRTYGVKNFNIIKKSKYLKRLIELHKLLINSLNNRGPRTNP
jgi:hypothetical protein